VLWDKASFPRDKVCGDAVSGKVFEVLNKLPNLHWQHWLQQPEQLPAWGVTFVAPNGKPLEVPFRPDPDFTQRAPGFLARRYDWDNHLFQLCCQHPNIEVHQGVQVRKAEALPTGQVRLHTATGAAYDTPWAVGAGGAHGVLGRDLALHTLRPRHHSAGVRWYWQGVEGLHPHGFIELHFIRRSLPGYFWIFPLPNGGANVGLGMRSDIVSRRRLNLKDMITDVVQNEPTLKERFRNACPEGPIRGFGLPMGSEKRKLSGPGWLLVGDEASLIDPFTGEGIGNALISGRLAALHIAQSLANPAAPPPLHAYDQAVYKRLWAELQLGSRMQQLCQYPWLFNLVVNKARRSPTLSRTISCMFDDVDLRAQFRKPSFYWKILWE
jgi:flavin-dependent dehydrogenase